MFEWYFFHQNDFKTQELPLARIKKIMKLDEDVKVILHKIAALLHLIFHYHLVMIINELENNSIFEAAGLYSKINMGVTIKFRISMPK